MNFLMQSELYFRIFTGSTVRVISHCTVRLLFMWACKWRMG